MRKKLMPRQARLDQQIRRAKAFASASSAPIAELYLLHAAICEERRKALKQKGRRALTAR